MVGPSQGNSGVDAAAAAVFARIPMPALFRAVSSNPVGVRYAVEDLDDGEDPELRHDLDDYLAGCDPLAVERAKADPNCRRTARGSMDLDRHARLCVAAEALRALVQSTRLQALSEEAAATGRPEPYARGGFADLPVDAEMLTSLNGLEYDGSKYSCGESSCLMLASNGAPNSTYWLAQRLEKLGDAKQVKIRLDPLLWGSKADYPSMVYKMLVYGQPLDWDRISRIHKVEHGRWVADSPFSKGEITEYAWSPRGSKVHFEIEEVPQQIDEGLTSARYLHAIFDPGSKTLEHVDGAVRVYSAAQQRARLATHLSQARKWGARAKVFRVDGAVPLDEFSNIAASFFVWNRDVEAYFAAGGSA